MLLPAKEQLLVVKPKVQTQQSADCRVGSGYKTADSGIVTVIDPHNIWAPALIPALRSILSTVDAPLAAASRCCHTSSPSPDQSTSNPESAALSALLALSAF